MRISVSLYILNCETKYSKKQIFINNILLLFQARADQKLVGVRAKRAKEAAENPDDVTKAAKEAKQKKAKK